MANVKIKISIGTIHFVGEGEDKWVEAQLDKIIKNIPDLIKLTPVETIVNTKVDAGSSNVATRIELTTGSIAAKLGCKSGTDLLKAAAAKLHLVDGKSRFFRRELLVEMQSASAFYKVTYSKNLTFSLKSLIKKNILLEPASDKYALSADSAKSLRSELG